MGSPELRKQRTRFVVGLGRAWQVMAGRANSAKPVIGVSIVRVLLHDPLIKPLALVPVGGKEEAAG